jgi:hypothetical protein
MKKMMLASATALGLAVLCSPASAATLIENKPYDPLGDIADNQVHSLGGAQDSSTINAFLQSTPDVSFFFTSTSNLESTGGGHATVTGNGGSGGDGFNDITLSIEDGFTFTALEVNLDGMAVFEPFNAIVEYSVLGSNAFVLAGEVTITNGSNFSLLASTGEFFDAVRFTGVDGARFNLIRQVDVNAQVAPVPEPATWAMFLIGFGAVGYSMRSRKVGYKGLQAV